MPKFVPVPNFDGLSPQTTVGDLIGRTTVGATRVGVGSDNTVLTADSTNALGLKWAAVSANVSVATLVGATTLPATSQTIFVSGTTFAITLPTPVSNSGLEYRFIKTDAFGIPISIGGSFIGVTLQTANEMYRVVCDGTKYWPIEHYAETSMTSYTPTVSGMGTPSNLAFFWNRVGDCINVMGVFASGTHTGSRIAFTLPVPAVTKGSFGITTQLCGQMTGSNGSANNFFTLFMPGSTTINVSSCSASFSGLDARIGTDLAQAVWGIQATIPILGWGA